MRCYTKLQIFLIGLGVYDASGSSSDSSDESSRDQHSSDTELRVT